MNRIAFTSLAVALLGAATPALAVTNDHGIVAFTQADALAGNVTPGDTPGFPVTINVGGSYRLASNLAVTTLVNGIEVRANEVSIDMGGFTLVGSGAGRHGVTSFNRAVRVRNGNIRGFTLDGVRSIAQFLSVSDMVITANGRHGVFADRGGGPDSTVSFVNVASSRVVANGGNGVYCFADCRVENSHVSTNGLTGIYFVGAGGLALGNSVTHNGNGGIFFGSPGGAGNNTVAYNSGDEIGGYYFPLQPNACYLECPPPP